MNARTSQLFGSDRLAQDRFHDAGSREPDEGVVALDHERALTGQVATSTRVVSEHQADAGDHPADLSQGRKGLAVAVETADSRRHERTRRVVHTDQRNAALGGHVDDAGELVAVGRVHRAGTYREVMTVDGDIPTVDLEDAGDDRGTVERGAPVVPQDVRLAVGEALDALPHRHPVLRVLDPDPLRSTASVRALAQLPAEGEGALVRALRCLAVALGRGLGQRIVEGVCGSRHAGGRDRRRSRA